jgi:hypothetical protein
MAFFKQSVDKRRVLKKSVFLLRFKKSFDGKYLLKAVLSFEFRLLSLQPSVSAQT